MPHAPQAFFHAAKQGGQRLYLYHSPQPSVASRGAVLYVHPWAEEMNKSRRMAAMASRQLADAGFAVLQIDLLGCGDSSGEFADASWEAWLDDLAEAADWLRDQYPHSPLRLWGLRVGALLATALAQRLALDSSRVNQMLFWQPTLQGKSAWQQFLRLKAAAQLTDGGGKAMLEAARAELAAGQAIDVAGYRVQPRLVAALEAATLAAPPAPEPGSAHSLGTRRVVWLELSSQPEPTPSPAATKAVQQWQAAGWTTELRAVPGPAFWQTAEIEDAPHLIQATIEALIA